MMEFTPIQPLWTPSLSAPKAEENDQQVKLEYQLATGQIDNPALVTTAITKATTAVELLMQMRNHAVEAYNELMRISL